MAQALKVIKFDPEEKSEGEQKSGGKNKSSLFSAFSPLSIAAIVTALLGVLSLVLEVRIYFQFRYEIYLARLFPTIFSLLTLIFLQTNFGKKQHVILTHIYLFTIISSLSFVSYKIPNLFVYNLTAGAFFLLTLSLFLIWSKNNQIFASVVYLMLFGVSAFFSSIIETMNNEFYLFISSSVITVILSILASSQKEKNRDTKENYSIPSSKSNVPEDENKEIDKRFWETSIVPLFQIKLNGEFDYANNALCEILEVTNYEQLYTQNFFEDFLKNEKVKNHLLKKIESKGKVENYRFSFTNQDESKEILIMDCKSKSIDDEIFLEGSIKVITQQFLKDKALAEEIETLKQIKRSKTHISANVEVNKREKTNIISKMGHELRTPMNSVLGFLTLIENGLFENEQELKEFSHSAKLSAESLLGLINDVVEIAKIQEGAIDTLKEDFNIRDEVEKLSAELIPHLKQNNVEFSYHIDESIPLKIISDQSKYYQILLNLLRNAIQVSDDGTINLTIKEEIDKDNQRMLVTSVEDSGKGMNQQELDNFLNNDLSVRGDAKITANMLHIMICKELLSLIEGKLTATSEVGKGTKFSFRILLEKSVEEGEAGVDDGFNKFFNNQLKSKLLLVEDNPISRKVEQKLLQEAGYVVDCVENATDAIEYVKKDIYNLVLMDIELKDMSGLEATKMIRELPSSVSNIPIIAVTAHSSMKDREKCLVAGMNDYISKPINITFLKMTIDQWLNEAKSQ